MAKFQRGLEFPHEGFVQKAIENFFSGQGYFIVEEGYADLVCICDSNCRKWIIEAKGKTTAIGLDFRTGIGQLVQRMNEQGINYAIAVPEIDQFIMQCSKISKWVRELLNIHFILVDEQSNVRIILPHEDF